MKMALGQLGWSPDQFWNATPREFWNALEGNYEQEQFRQRQQWERTRWQTVWLLNVHLTKNSQVEPKDLIEFPWESERKPAEIPTDDDVKRILERDKKLLKCQS